jgi:hypothetical protein
LPTADQTVIAYGSLMSGLGLALLAPLPVADAFRVRLSGCRRGFGKFSQYGDRFAMVLEPFPAGEPIRAERLTTVDPSDAGIQAMAFTLPMPDLARVAQREGYRADALLALARQADAAGRGLAAHLAALLDAAGHDVVRYRRALADAVDYTSPHYVPHPVALADGEHALTFVPPGPEGSGRADVVPIRVQSAETRLLTVRQVWRIKPNASQMDYLAMCLLAEVHGISLADVVADLAAYPPLATLIEKRLAAERPSEVARFQKTLELTPDRYAERFCARV